MKLIDLSDIQKFRKGEEEAFEKIYNAYKNIVFHECLVRLKCKEDAEDCFQEIFLKLVNVIKQYDEKVASFDSWFTTIYKNHISNYIRSKINRGKYNESIDYEEIIKYEDNSQYYINLMIDLINLVGEESYKILIYRIRYGLTLRKIGSILGISKDTVNRKYLEALDIIKRYYNK